MKRIALFVHNLTVDYSLSLAQSVASFFTQDKDAKLILAQTNIPHYQPGLFEYQYWAGAELLKAEDIDLIMIISSAYQTYSTPEEVIKYFKKFTNKPIVSIAMDLPFDNVHYTVSYCDKAIDNVVEHLVNVHGCTNIGFLAATKTNSKEALIRFQAYRNALTKHNLKFDPSYVLEGYFIRQAAYDRIKENYKSKVDIPFDALICSNDLMAEGALKAFSEIGVKVPEDIKVIGFDNIVRSSFTVPTLSTINQDLTAQGYKAAEIAYKITQGTKVPRETKIAAEPVYRQSCGCIKKHDNSFKNKNQAGKLVNNALVNQEIIEEYTESSKDMIGIYTLIDTIHTTNTLRDFFNSLSQISMQMKFASMAVVLYDQPVSFKKNEDIVIPEKAELRTFIQGNKLLHSYDDKPIEVEPLKKLLPNEFAAQQGGVFIVHPIFSGEKHYGYLMVQATNSKFHIHHVYLKLIINAIANAYDFDKTLTKNEALTSKNERLLKNNQELNFQNSIDELTQVLNRRGFMDKAEKALKKAKKEGRSGIVFFADMDGLKKINDTWGHKIGDLAIQTEANVLSEAFSDNDIVGRLSGDEFAILSTGLTKGYISPLKERIRQLNKIYSEKAELPLIVSLSLGFVEFTPEKCNLDELLSKADQVLYKEKEIKHATANKKA